jgi:FkbM family methyltransferase
MDHTEQEHLAILLTQCVEKNNGTPFQRVLKQPLQLLWSKLLEKTCLARQSTMKLKARLFWGEDMNVVFPEIVSCFLYRYGFFEPDLTKIVMTHLKPGQTFFDVGTHFGYYSMLASRLVGHEGQVHGFEPTMETYKIVHSNLELKNNVTLNNVAAWSEETTLKFTDYGVQYSAFNSLYGAKLEDSMVAKMRPKDYDVKAISIDKYVDESGVRPDFIKIDAENAEYDILKGMTTTLKDIRPIITLEVGDVNEGAFKSSIACVHFLIEHNYKVLELRDGALCEHEPDQKYSHANLLFIPQ